MTAGVASEDQFVALAAARTALLGSVHDALMTQIAEATGRPRSESAVPAPGEQQPANLLAAGRSWLSDLARSGWQGLDNDVISAGVHVVSAMLPDPALRRLATLLDEEDERASLGEQGLDAPPLAHDHLELGEPCHGLIAREVDQARAAIADSLYLGRSVQDVPIRRSGRDSRVRRAASIAS